MKKIIVAIIIFATAVVFWIFFKDVFAKKNDASPYTIEKVSRGDLAVSFLVDGNIVFEKWELKFLNSGIVDKINVKLGDVVKRGQVLASIDVEKNANQLLQAKSEVSASNIDFDRLSSDGVDFKIKKNAYSDSQEQLKKEKDLYDEYVKINGEGSTQALAQKVKVVAAETDENNAKYQIKQVQESYKKAEYELSKSSAAYGVALSSSKNYNLISPKNNATVDAINGNIGDVVLQNSSSASDTVGFMTLVNKDNFWFEALVEDTDALKIQKDMVAYIILDAYPELKFNAKVDFIALTPQIDANGIPSYKVIIKLIDNYDTKFLSNMTGSAELVSREAKDVLMVSNNAVKSVEGKQTVVVKNGDIFSEKVVQTGFTNGKKVEIKSGLNQGEEVVIIK